MPVLYLFQVLSIEQQSRVGWALSLSTITKFTFPEIWKWHAVLLGIHARGANTKISECLGVSLKTNSYSY